MGNQHSNDDHSLGINADVNRRPFVRGGGNALGLSRSELDKRCQPSGLYDSCSWDERAIRKLIGDGKAAARLKGAEFRTSPTDYECPICFLYYEDVNTTKCCNANICTECFLQVRPQKDKQSTCPFCNHSKLSISIAKKLTDGQIKEREEDERRTEEARIQARDGEKSNEAHNDPSNPLQQQQVPKSPASGSQDGFGSSLEQDARVAMFRARSESFASNEHNDGALGSQSYFETKMIESVAMTPEERRRLEDEMKNQSSHPLALQMEAEAQQRRLQNDRLYHRSNSDQRGHRMSDLQSSRSLRRRLRSQYASGPRDWNQIVDAFERGGNGEINSLDDLVVLEAAILLSMEEEARQARTGDSGNISGIRNSNNSSSTTESPFDATRHARDGFPLVRSFLANRGLEDEPAAHQQVQNIARTLSSSRRRNQLLRSGYGPLSSRGMGDTAMDTAALLMRGISEEEQLAMAIAASLQEQDASTNDASEETHNDENDGNQRRQGENVGDNNEGQNEEPHTSNTISPGTAVGILVEEENNTIGENDHSSGNGLSALRGEETTAEGLSEVVESSQGTTSTDNANGAEEPTPSVLCNDEESPPIDDNESRKAPVLAAATETAAQSSIHGPSTEAEIGQACSQEDAPASGTDPATENV